MRIVSRYEPFWEFRRCFSNAKTMRFYRAFFRYAFSSVSGEAQASQMAAVQVKLVPP